MSKPLFLVIFSTLFTISTAGQVPKPAPIVSVPDINGRATSLVKPEFPETAVVTGADGNILTLKVVVDENGNVISAQCSLTCHPMLKDAAELAAMTSKFRPLEIEGRAVKYQGILQYTFVVKNVNWYRFGTALESTRQFDNISLGPVAQILSADFASEKARLLTVDANGGADYESRQKTINEVTAAIRSRLKGMDLWRFDLGMALRRVTFWTQAAERTERPVLQKAINGLASLIASAPESVSEAVITELTAISRYRIPADISEQELRKAIFNLTRNIQLELR